MGVWDNRFQPGPWCDLNEREHESCRLLIPSLATVTGQANAQNQKSRCARTCACVVCFKSILSMYFFILSSSKGWTVAYRIQESFEFISFNDLMAEVVKWGHLNVISTFNPGENLLSIPRTCKVPPKLRRC